MTVLFCLALFTFRFSWFCLFVCLFWPKVQQLATPYGGLSVEGRACAGASWLNGCNCKSQVRFSDPAAAAAVRNSPLLLSWRLLLTTPANRADNSKVPVIVWGSLEYFEGWYWVPNSSLRCRGNWDDAWFRSSADRKLGGNKSLKCLAVFSCCFWCCLAALKIHQWNVKLENGYI